MPFPRPTLTELRAQVAADINGDLPGVDALLRYSNLGITGAILAALANGHYGYIDWIALNSVPFTAEGEYLEGWAALKGVTRKPAVPATGTAIFTGTDGTTIPSGTPLTRADGVGYVTTASGTIASGTAMVAIAASDGGSDGNAPNGSTLTLATAISGIASSAVAGTSLAGGADTELDDDLRSRMLTVYAAPPQGGARTDYIEWALAVAGVTRCWVSVMGAGAIVLFFMMDEAEAAFDGFPQGTNGCATGEARDAAATGDQLTLANAIFARQPVQVLVYACAPTPNHIGLTIAGIPGASTATRNAIAAAVTKALRIDAVPGGVTNVSSIEAAIASVAGTAGFVLTGVTASAGSVSPGAAGNITSNAGALPVLYSVSYV